jgi:phosphoenolpyruvate carboxylase
LSLGLPHTARSLWECGGGNIADGRLLDLIRRVYSFGMSLLKLDLRQESTRHAETLDAITTYLGYGSYKAWDEDTKCEFITRELETRRPLIPLNMPMTDEVRAAQLRHTGAGQFKQRAKTAAAKKD